VTRPTIRRVLIGVGLTSVLVLSGVTPAQAHPLGNFSINHLDTLTFGSDRIVDDAIVDTAEIPTAQAKGAIDASGDGTASAAELSQYGSVQCELYRQALHLDIDGQAVTLSTTSTAFTYRPGQAGLRTTRLECHFQAPADLSMARNVVYRNEFARNRVGWHEIVAIGDGSRIDRSPVPTTSVTKGLTSYPVDLLASPLDVRDASFHIVPGRGASTQSAASKPSPSRFSTAIGPFSGLVERVNKTFNDLVGRHQLTLAVGLLAIGLALILGASHALLPGHGKTVMAAYIAGRQGSVRDAVLVGATVTATHTGGVLLLGLALSVSTSLAGESVLSVLGVISGLMIAVLGASLLKGAHARRNSRDPAAHRHGFGKIHSHGPQGQSHGPHDHSHGHGSHSHSPRPQDRLASDLGFIGPSRQTLLRKAGAASSGNVALAGQPTLVVTDLLDRVGILEPVAPHQVPFPIEEPKKFSRKGLIGMGIAGGLVPSPSALVVLLSAIALGRTIFGIVLVIGYGAGMAATLTLAGVLLVRVRDRCQQRASTESWRLRRLATRWTHWAPYLTAALVLVVGLGLAIRSLGAV